jgi:hypothetical protein
MKGITMISDSATLSLSFTDEENLNKVHSALLAAGYTSRDTEYEGEFLVTKGYELIRVKELVAALPDSDIEGNSYSAIIKHTPALTDDELEWTDSTTVLRLLLNSTIEWSVGISPNSEAEIERLTNQD